MESIDSAEVFADMCKFCDNVTNINCSYDFTASDYEAIAQHWPGLTTIQLGCGYDDRGVTAIANGCTLLSQLFVPAVSRSTFDQAWQSFFETVGSNLRAIVSEGALGDTSLIPPLCPLLRRLKMGHGVLTDNILQSLAQHCPLLEAIDLSASVDVVTLDGILPIARRGRLQELTMDICGEGAGWEAKFDQLVKHSPLLREVIFTCRDMTPAVRNLSKYCRHLEMIAISPPEEEVDGWGHCDSEALVALVVAKPGLRDFMINGNIGDDVMCALGKYCRHVQSLCFAPASEATDAGIVALAAGCRFLTFLGVLQAPVTATGVQALADHCPHVRRIVTSTSVEGCDTVVGLAWRNGQVDVDWIS
jgi:hypothetical protein